MVIKLPEILSRMCFTKNSPEIFSFKIKKKSGTKSDDTNSANVYFIISLGYLDFEILFEFISVSMIKFTNCFKQMTSV